MPGASPDPDAKSRALEACAEQHLDLLQCFRNCRSLFGFCCREEHTAFWDCYKTERGIDSPPIPFADAVKGFFSGLTAAPSPQQQFFMQNAFLHLAPSPDVCKPGRGELLASKGSITAKLLLQLQEHHDPMCMVMSLDLEAKKGCAQDALHTVPLYVHAKEVCTPEGTIEALELTYITFYAHNGWYALAGFSWSPRVGAHDGDWEHLTMRLQAPSFSLQGVWFNAHRPCDGCWLPAAQVERTASGRPIAYVARHGHGTYPHAGVYKRAGFFANDHCSDHGPEWNPDRCVLLPSWTQVQAATDSAGPVTWMRVSSRGSRIASSLPLAPTVSTRNVSKSSDTTPDTQGVEVVEEPALWLQFRGMWGTTPGPACQTWWARAECPVSRGVFLRIVGHLWPERDNA
ncbi:hypothetical protein WJX73_007386 [Symbiochloris irregularis]|uniref:Uncharacterized protein n=1 Tax=Symbiochloris irregularis TaxID=706552 RepID=A0AAW1NQE9_9CHLO